MHRGDVLTKGPACRFTTPPQSLIHGCSEVDERVAPAGHPDRNLTHLRESLLAHAPLPEGHLYAMPVVASGLEAAAAQYAVTLQSIAGSPPVLDLVHLGLGSDGHTASLVPGDAVLDVTDRDVAVTGIYQGRRRMTVTGKFQDRCRVSGRSPYGGSPSSRTVRLLSPHST